MEMGSFVQLFGPYNKMYLQKMCILRLVHATHYHTCVWHNSVQSLGNNARCNESPSYAIRIPAKKVKN